MQSWSGQVVRGLLAGLLAAWMGGSSSGAAEARMLDSAVLSELGGKVWVMDPGKPLRTAALRQKVAGPSAVKTGDGSRAEMEFPEGSLVRLGANAVFSFRRGTRELTLNEGALLLRVPKGIGASTTVRTAAATAAISGTTVIVSATKQGGFRMVVLEGAAEARYGDGVRVRCNAGETTVRRPGEPSSRMPSEIHLGALVASSRLIAGFKRPLPSLDLIRAAIRLQQERIEEGTLSATGRTLDATTLDPFGSDRDPGLIRYRTPGLLRPVETRTPRRDPPSSTLPNIITGPKTGR